MVAGKVPRRGFRNYHSARVQGTNRHQSNELSRKNGSQIAYLEFKLEYFNTSSTLIIRNVIRKLASINHQTELKVKWYFENDDEDMQEAGDEFKLLFKDVSFDIIGVNHF